MTCLIGINLQRFLKIKCIVLKSGTLSANGVPHVTLSLIETC